jgi:hypothetical protein
MARRTIGHAEADELLRFLPLMTTHGPQTDAVWEGGETLPDGTSTVPHPRYPKPVEEFFRAASQDWWRDVDYVSKEAAHLVADDHAIATADLSLLKTMLTYCVRGERFCDGHWDALIRDGRIAAILQRLAELRATILPVRTGGTMLTENQIVRAVCDHLAAAGYEVISQLLTTQRGRDIVARAARTPPLELRIEAKGATSDRQGSARYGKPFSATQVRDHVAAAFYCAAAMRGGPQDQAEVRVGVAFPETRLHRARVADIASSLAALRIAVFWVRDDLQVVVEGHWAP